ncbi:MAG: protein phosphatase 2C domain-containing protein [Candidatus Dormibacteria bacterium]
MSQQDQLPASTTGQPPGMPAGVPARPGWLLFTASAPGAAHRGVALPNQDAVGSQGDPGLAAAEPLAVAVADGHGDLRHFRSARGSRLAVDVACALARDLGAQVAGASTAEAARVQLTVWLLPRIVRGWLTAVAEDVAGDPFSSEEAGHRRPGDDPVIAYGSTLLVVLLAGRWLLLAQIGDGDILVVEADGRAAAPVPPDPSIHGSYTTSLCQSGALSLFRVAVIDQGELPVGAILLATDGFGNAQAVEPWHQAVGADLLAFVRDRGAGWVGEQLPGWAARCASAQGSGDDTTLALLVRGVPGGRP